jgi:cell division transport system permease protein
MALSSSPDIARLERQLRTASPHAVLDDHRRWIGRLRTTANTVVLSAFAILALIALATAATVAFATRAGLAAHREIVELLHLMGAKDRFIARAFEWHYFLAALIAAVCGAAFAAAAFLGAGSLDQFGLASVSFLPPLGLPLSELPWLAGARGGLDHRPGNGARFGHRGAARPLLSAPEHVLLIWNRLRCARAR